MRGPLGLLLLAACGRVGFDAGSVDSGHDGVSPANVPFAFRKPITIDRMRNASGVDLADIPIAIRVTDQDLQMVSAGGKLDTGADLAFYAADGVTPLAFELDGLSSSGDLLAWVKLPVFSATANTSLFLAFGDPMTTSVREDRGGTWSHDYVGVWHFSEPSYSGTAGETQDAIGAHSGTASTGVSTIASGKLGRAASFAGNCSYISIAASTALQPPSVTVSAWVNPADIGTSTERIDTIVAQDYWRTVGSGSQGYYLEVYRTVSQPEP
ncbi:MAG TPA: hypothetical protein VLB44_22420, partial [Kofleriaceae bacterium]|nr:hypothetical protein [Kofleriaceae bacterium]